MEVFNNVVHTYSTRALKTSSSVNNKQLQLLLMARARGCGASSITFLKETLKACLQVFINLLPDGKYIKQSAQLYLQSMRLSAGSQHTVHVMCVRISLSVYLHHHLSDSMSDNLPRHLLKTLLV